MLSHSGWGGGKEIALFLVMISTGKCSNFLKPMGFHVQPCSLLCQHSLEFLVTGNVQYALCFFMCPKHLTLCLTYHCSKNYLWTETYLLCSFWSTLWDKGPDQSHLSMVATLPPYLCYQVSRKDQYLVLCCLSAISIMFFFYFIYETLCIMRNWYIKYVAKVMI